MWIYVIQCVLGGLLVCLCQIDIRLPHLWQSHAFIQKQTDRGGRGLLSAGDSNQIKAYMYLIICSAEKDTGRNWRQRINLCCWTCSFSSIKLSMETIISAFLRPFFLIMSYVFRKAFYLLLPVNIFILSFLMYPPTRSFIS